MRDLLAFGVFIDDIEGVVPSPGRRVEGPPKGMG